MNLRKICAVGLMSIGIGASFSVSAACSEGITAVTKSGFYAALNQNDYSKMQNAVENGNEDVIKNLVQAHSIIKVPEGVEVCIKDPREGFQWYRKHITIPGYPSEYWISDKGLNEVN